MLRVTWGSVLMVVVTGCVVRVPGLENFVKDSAPAPVASSDTPDQPTYQEKLAALRAKERKEEEAGRGKASDDRAVKNAQVALDTIAAAERELAKANGNVLAELEEERATGLKSALSSARMVTGPGQWPELHATAAWQPVKQRMQALEAKIVDAVKLPTDAYAQADAASVRASYAKLIEEFTRKKVSKVVLRDSDWNRQRGQEWVGGTLRQYDQGFVRAWAVLKGDGDTSEVWYLRPRKDWLDGGKIKNDVYVPSMRALMRTKTVDAR